MLNRNPLFVNGFSRGGTTILTNLIASHPDVCLIGETHHVFKGTSLTDSPWRVLGKCLYHDAPIIVGQVQNFFSPRLIKPRRRLSRWAEQRIDEVMYHEKFRATHPVLNRFKTSQDRYTRAEIESSRLLCKNIDGMIYATDAWKEMYRDATFFGLVRNGLALCEGHLRRGRSASEIGWRYQILVQKMLHDARTVPRYRLVRFEDLIAAPWETLRATCDFAGLDPHRIREIRMQARRVMDAEGNHRLDGRDEWDVEWLRIDELEGYFERNVDQNQIKRLSSADRAAFLKQASGAMQSLGYAVSRDTPHVDARSTWLPRLGACPTSNTLPLRRAA